MARRQSNVPVAPSTQRDRTDSIFHRARKPATQRSTTGAASADFHPRLEDVSKHLNPLRVLPISIVRDELGLPVGAVNPRGHPSYELRRVASFFKRIRKGILEGSQLPPTLTNERGTITKPTKWERPG
jgi:hypothetical protein